MFEKKNAYCFRIAVACCFSLSLLEMFLLGSNMFTRHHETLVIDTQKILHLVDKHFLSITLDSSLIRRQWEGLNLTSEFLVNVASTLSPAILRLGGTSADRLIFVENSTDEQATTWQEYPLDGGVCSYEDKNCNDDLTNFTMSGLEWISINQFAQRAGFDVLFDLNVLLRNSTEWDDTNAREIIEFSDQHNFPIMWQLGNEPDAFHHVFNMTLSSQQLGRDVSKLKRLLSLFPSYKATSVVGPDVTRPRPQRMHSVEYLSGFLQEAEGVINAVTWHQYYLNGRTASMEDFIDPQTFNVLINQVNIMNEAVRKIDPNIPIWLGETSTAYGGGAPGLSDRFVAGFLWLDKLGLAARMGINVVIRQSFYGGNYGLIDRSSEPLPDYWLSSLFKLLVGHQVLSADLVTQSRDYVRFYCHCTNTERTSYAPGALTIFGMNLKPSTIEVTLQGTWNSSEIHQYLLTGRDGLESRFSLLNGKEINLKKSGMLPDFVPVLLSPESSITIPPYSMGFWILPKANVPICI